MNFYLVVFYITICVLVMLFIYLVFKRLNQTDSAIGIFNSELNTVRNSVSSLAVNLSLTRNVINNETSYFFKVERYFYPQIYFKELFKSDKETYGFELVKKLDTYTTTDNYYVEENKYLFKNYEDAVKTGNKFIQENGLIHHCYIVIHMKEVFIEAEKLMPIEKRKEHS